MTPQNIDQAPAMALPSIPHCLVDVLPPLLDAYEAETANFEYAKNEIASGHEQLSEIDKWKKAARSVVGAANAEAVAILKKNGSTPKDALKAKVKQRLALEDIETFNAVAADVESDNKRWELKAHQAANAVRFTRDAARNASIAVLKEALIGRLPQEYFMLVELITEFADSGDSVEFNTDPIIKSPLEFALREVSFLVAAAIPANRHDFGLCAILPESPSGLDSFGKSPIQMQNLTEELARQEATQ